MTTLSAKSPSPTGNVQAVKFRPIFSDMYGVKMLPAELYIKIMEYLDFRSLIKCMQLSTVLRDLIKKSVSLQYIIELAVAGQLDNPGCALNSADRLERLRKHQNAWTELKWSREYSIPLQEGGLWELYGGVLGQNTPQGTFLIHQLPSNLRSVEEKTWTIGPDFGVKRIRDFTMDPSQDLLVLLESPDWSVAQEVLDYHLHLRTLTSGIKHPLAVNTATLTFERSDGDPGVSHTLQVCGDLLLLVLSGFGEPELVIWNWKNGVQLLNIYGGDILSASILSQEWVVLCIVNQDGWPCLATLNLREEGRRRNHLENVKNLGVFTYPELSDRADFDDMNIRCDPGPLYKADPNPATPFYQNTEDFIFVVTLWVIQGTMRRRSMVHLIPASHLLALAESTCQFPVTTPWDTWGGSGSRLMIPVCLASDVWVCYVYGNKYIMIEPKKADRSGFRARLLDFNQLALKRGAGEGSALEALGVIFKQHSMQKFFEQSVDTTLPYRSPGLHLEEIHSHCKVLCSEDSLILVDEDCGDFRVLVF